MPARCRARGARRPASRRASPTGRPSSRARSATSVDGAAGGPPLRRRPRIVARRVIDFDQCGHRVDVVGPRQRQRAPAVARGATVGSPRPPRPAAAAQPEQRPPGRTAVRRRPRRHRDVGPARRPSPRASAENGGAGEVGATGRRTGQVGQPAGTPLPAASAPSARPRTDCPRRSELQGGESPVQHLPVGLTDRVDQRPERQHPAAAAGQRPSPPRRASRCTACRPRAPVRCGRRTPSPSTVTRFGSSAGRLGERQPDGVSAVHQALAADPRIMVRRGDVEAQPGQLGCAADDVAGAVQHRARDLGVEVRARYPLPEGLGVPVGGGIGAPGPSRPRSPTGRRRVRCRARPDSAAASHSGRSRGPAGRPGRWSSSAGPPDPVGARPGLAEFCFRPTTSVRVYRVSPMTGNRK